MTARRALPPSLYADTAQPGPETPPLEGEVRTGVAIVGGGFTGLSAALHLAEQGVACTVLESNEVGWGASGRNGGQVNPGLKFDPDVIERHQIQCEAHRGGTIRAAKSARNAALVRASAEKWAQRTDAAVLLERDGMREATGTGRYLVGMRDRRGGSVNPLGYARGLARAAQQAGARIHGASPALRTEKVPGGWRVTTPRGSVHAEKLALCTNGYTDGLWPGLARSVVPVFSMIAATAPLQDAVARAVMPARSVLFEIAATTVYYRLDQQGRLLMGGRSPSRETSASADFQYLIEYSEKLFPALQGVSWTHFWNGQLAITTDHYPHFHEPEEGVLAALAYNGRGVAMATTMGAQIADRFLGARPDELMMPITTLREIPFHGLWRTAVSLRLVYGRIRDSLGL
ncbi:MAG TPA: FAD-binding oxidoreductase [Acetobacteraceae bacterium]|nr:FAD-binding oxidoreductase [Acetobacteraceae bacterium]